MEVTLICFAVSFICFAWGIAGILSPMRLRRQAMKMYSSSDRRWRLFPPIGWMWRQENQHLWSIRASGLIALVMGSILLIVGIMRLWQ